MPGRLGDIHRRLRADHVPAVLEYRPGLGTVVLAGIDREHPAGSSGVVLHEAGGQYWLRQGGETFRLPRDADDDMLVNSVKLRVVHAWAEQGDRAAAAVLTKVHEMVRHEPPRPQAPAFPDPFALAFEMFDTAFRFGWTMTVPSPWGMFRTSFTVR
ncbi:MAG TPA: hypothetical protein VIC62_06120 [Nakamurella sp.]|jgi:hypothetical protein